MKRLDENDRYTLIQALSVARADTLNEAKKPLPEKIVKALLNTADQYSRLLDTLEDEETILIRD